VVYEKVTAFKQGLLAKAYARFEGRGDRDDYQAFCAQNAHWLADFSLFLALKTHFGGRPWSRWPPEFRDRAPEALRWAAETFREVLERVRFVQYLLFRQWHCLKEYCNGRGLRIFGDIPVYVVLDSADVWLHPELFNLDPDRNPVTVAGVPPDYFSATGQLWGNPVYRWDVLKERGYDWWIGRMRHNLQLYDMVRVDHFRGFVAYWEVPCHERNAVNGCWVQAPAWDFFDRITAEFPGLPIVAEDLGFITPEVVEVKDHFKFPGMKILLFAFGDDLPTNPYAPHNLERDCVVYTGTHDNNTARGWLEKETTPEIRERIRRYIGKEISGDSIAPDLIRLAMMSVARTVIFPLQDLLGLGEEARMNQPATRQGNWEWRLAPESLTTRLAQDLRAMTEIYGRA
jgi:4-alpha-glucanotransferase